jgi:hypothetical protein
MLVRSLLVSSVLVLAGTSASAEDLRYDFRLETGGEYDSNPTRAETVAGVSVAKGSPLLRLVASGSLDAEMSQRLRLAWTGGLGGKWFSESSAEGEDVLVLNSQAVLSYRLREDVVTSAQASYYDALQRGRVDARDFRSMSPALRMEYLPRPSLRLGAAGGYRRFDFKPDAAFSFRAPTALLYYRQVHGGDVMVDAADWEWGVSLSYEHRAFTGSSCGTAGCANASTAAHRDHFVVGQLDVTRIGGFLLGGGVAVQANRSSVYGESLLREVFHLRGVVPLPLGLTASARVEVVVTQYRDRMSLTSPVTGTVSATIEDERRSTLRVELSRPLGSHVELGARYVFYTSDPSAGSLEYQRQTFLLFFAVVDESS